MPNYILYKQKNGQEKKPFSTIYGDTFKDAMKEFSQGIRNGLLQSNENIIYIKSLNDFLNSLNSGETYREKKYKNKEYIKNYDWQGKGYYLNGIPLILDNKDISEYKDNAITWILSKETII